MKTTSNLGELLAQARLSLRAAGAEQPALEAQAVAAALLSRSRAWVLAHPEVQPTEDQVAQFIDWVEQLTKGTPLPYLTGRQAFYDLEFIVSPAVLIPRPETEWMVEQALAWLSAHPGPRRVADVGAGSGCIAVSIAARAPQATLWAVDPSRSALMVARQNCARYHLLPQRVRLVQADLLSPFQQPFDLVCANLPYIPTAILNELAVKDHEPILALDGGPDGLTLVRRLLAQLGALLRPGGMAWLEIEETTGSQALAAAQSALPHLRCRLAQDLAGRDRFLELEG